MASISIPRTQEQERAAQAWHDVDKIKSKSFNKKYKSLVRSAPADIQTNGLGQTIAFWRAKAKGKTENEHYTLYQHLSLWLKSKFNLSADLQAWIIDQNTSSNEYRLATVEALAYLGWLKRFAESQIEGEEEAQ